MEGTHKAELIDTIKHFNHGVYIRSSATPLHHQRNANIFDRLQHHYDFHRRLVEGTMAITMEIPAINLKLIDDDNID